MGKIAQLNRLPNGEFGEEISYLSITLHLLIRQNGKTLQMDSTQQLKKQLKDLREEVQIRTSELEAKTRELTREAKIQLALERVRARTMAMQHSEELQETALLLFQQIEELGIPMFACGFNIWDDDKQAASAWMAGKDRIQLPFKTSSREDIFARIYKASQNGDSLFVEDQANHSSTASSRSSIV